MSAEFKSFATILEELRELRELRDGHAAEPEPAISPLIAEIAAPPAFDRLRAARTLERVDLAIRELLHEIATEVLGRELLLAPVDVDTIVRRLRERYRIDDGDTIYERDGDITIEGADGIIDASLGRRLAGALERASR